MILVVVVVPITQAIAYSIHKKNGEYKIECDNGVTSQGSTLQITHAEAEHFCKVRGSSMSANPSANDTNPNPVEKTPDALNRAAQAKKLERVMNEVKPELNPDNEKK